MGKKETISLFEKSWRSTSVYFCRLGTQEERRNAIGILGNALKLGGGLMSQRVSKSHSYGRHALFSTLPAWFCFSHCLKTIVLSYVQEKIDLISFHSQLPPPPLSLSYWAWESQHHHHVWTRCFARVDRYNLLKGFAEGLVGLAGLAGLAALGHNFLSNHAISFADPCYFPLTSILNKATVKLR